MVAGDTSAQRAPDVNRYGLAWKGVRYLAYLGLTRNGLRSIIAYLSDESARADPTAIGFEELWAWNARSLVGHRD